MTAEQKIVFLLSRLRPSPEAMASARDLITGSSLDYRRLVALAHMNGVSPLLYHSLKSLEGVPEGIMGELRNTYLCAMRDNIGTAAEVMRLLSLLKEHGIDAIPLKGPVASDIIFGNPGLYPSGDLDILVRPSDLERTKKALLDEGYRESALDERDMLQSSYHINFWKEGYFLEVHWTLTFRYFEVPPEFWWEEVGVMDYQGMEIRALSAERYLLYSIFRLYSHAFRPLRFLVLVAEIINKYRNELDWQSLSFFSEKFRMARLVRFTVKLLHDLLGLDIPETVAKKRLFGYGWLKRLVLSGLFRDVEKIHPRMLLFTALQQSPLDTLRILSQRIFPPLSEIRLRYNLPAGSKKLYAYYLLNPILMIIRKR